LDGRSTEEPVIGGGGTAATNKYCKVCGAAAELPARPHIQGGTRSLAAPLSPDLFRDPFLAVGTSLVAGEIRPEPSLTGLLRPDPPLPFCLYKRELMLAQLVDATEQMQKREGSQTRICFMRAQSSI
jgi:hypothetical protein